MQTFIEFLTEDVSIKNILPKPRKYNQLKASLEQEGEKIYLIVPREDKEIWERHLKGFDISPKSVRIDAENNNAIFRF